MGTPATVRTLGLGLFASLLLAVPAQAVTPFKTITSGGPLTAVAIGNEGSSQISYRGAMNFELSPSAAQPGDCATLISRARASLGPGSGWCGSVGSAAAGIG